ncbi:MULTISPECIES: cupin [unclassified Actinomyces]|uniref:cupin n=1 Tax=unclassified Actinomyces TaxID=2609248 RepID=UPI0020183CDC|nr:MULTISPECIES: cupin [unclassified Actinomyces]MCL3777217.1 cupin [Actinomyces sp. AC-20-1]MCL3789292.1 cupin [Actinomyces sp. 187325]MCL3791712.1 cupin [Actinomyces sp. 186855]MCL3794248.1 cupin [Actinomyces sp. 217892]
MNVLRAEALKAACLPSLRWTVALTAAACVLVLAALRQDAPAADSVTPEAIAAALWTWAGLVQAGFLAVGVLMSTKEHMSAMGSTTLLVVPGRGAVWAGRLVVLAAAVLPVAVVLAATALVVLDQHPARASVEVAVRTGAWLVAVALLSAGTGALLRHVLATTSVLLLLVVVAPATSQALGSWATWLPGAAAQDWVREGAWHDGAVVLAWVVTAVVAGGLRLVRSDA